MDDHIIPVSKRAGDIWWMCEYCDAHVRVSYGPFLTTAGLRAGARFQRDHRAVDIGRGDITCAHRAHALRIPHSELTVVSETVEVAA